MYEEKDYIMRLIRELVRMIARLALGKDIEEEADVPVEVLERYQRLLMMIEDGDINAAENLLLDSLDVSSLQDFQLALMFYQKLSEKPEEFLARQQYSRAEILEGITYVAGFYGYGNMVEALIEDV